LKLKIPELVLALKGQLTVSQADKLSIAMDNLKNFNGKIFFNKGNRYLKAVLIQCVKALSRSKKESRLIVRLKFP